MATFGALAKFAQTAVYVHVVTHATAHAKPLLVGPTPVVAAATSTDEDPQSKDATQEHSHVQKEDGTELNVNHAAQYRAPGGASKRF